MVFAFVSVIVGLCILLWSANKFVDGAASTARHFDVPPLLIGMLVIGFGTSAPEMIVSVMASFEGNSNIALANAYGSNITNIGLILGITAIMCPIAVQSRVVRKELPLLIAVSVLAFALAFDGAVSRVDGIILLSVFFLLTGWSIWEAKANRQDSLATDVEGMNKKSMSVKSAILWSGIGLVGLVFSSNLLISGVVYITTAFGISETIIGLTVVAMGTSLPELASAIVAVRKKEHDLALGNILGSNLFNTLAVVGLAGVINPLSVDPEIISRDMPVMIILTLVLLLLCYGTKARPGRISRVEGVGLLMAYTLYTINLIMLVLLTRTPVL